MLKINPHKGKDCDDPRIKSLQIGDIAPNFTCETNLGMFTYHEVIDGKIAVLVTFPQNFDPVATTELGTLAKLHEEFSDRSISIYGLSVDTKANHRKWIEDVEEIQDCKINFPIICDRGGSISKAFGLNCRGEYSVNPLASMIVITDLDRRIRYLSLYPATIGRNFFEIIRIIDTLHLTLFHPVCTPANWMQGEDVLIQKNIETESAKSIFKKGIVVIKDWFRITPQPNSDSR